MDLVGKRDGEKLGWGEGGEIWEKKNLVFLIKEEKMIYIFNWVGWLVCWIY